MSDVKAKQRIEAKVSSTDDQMFDEELADFDAVTPAWDAEADFEEGDVSDFDAVSGTWDNEVDAVGDFDAEVDGDGDLNDTTVAAHDGAVGLEITFDDNNAAYGVMNAIAIDQTSGVFSFYFDPNQVQLDHTKVINTVVAYTGAPVEVIYFQVRINAGTYQVRTRYRNDAAGVVSSGWEDISDEYHRFLLVFAMSTGVGNNDGYIYLYIDDALLISQTGLDNDTQDWDTARFGMIFTNSAAFGGSFYMDTIKIDTIGQVMADQLAAHDGDYGMTISFNDSTAKYGTLNADAVNQVSGVFSFWFDPNSVSLENGKVINIAVAYDGGANAIVYIQLKNNAGTYQLRTRYLDDGAAIQNSSYEDIADDYQHIVCMFLMSTGVGNDDGFVRLYVDDALLISQTGIDNDTRDWDLARVGIVFTNSTTFGGIFYMDTFKIDPIGGPMVDKLAARRGTYGMAIPIMNNTFRRGEFTGPTAEKAITAECWFDPNSLTMGEGDSFAIFSADPDTQFEVYFEYSGGNYQIAVLVSLDAGASATSYYPITDTWHHIRVVWVASSTPGADDGYVHLFIDNVLQESLTGLDNDTITPGTIYFGAVIDLDDTTYGIFYMDDCRWGPWKDITSDVIGNIKGFWGMVDNGPLDFLADTGWMRFILDNSSGIYSQGVAGGLSGWGKGTPIQLTLTYSGLQYKRFYGTIGNLIVESGSFGGEKVIVEVVDWMDYAATHPLVSPAVQTEKRGDEMLVTILADMPINPRATDFAIGVNTFPTVFDTVSFKTKAYSEMMKIALSELGPIYLIKDPVYGETLVFENAQSRSGLEEPVATFDNSMVDLETEYGENVINRFVNIANPRYIEDGLSVLFALGSPIYIAPGETLTIRGNYTDPSGGANAVGANMEAPATPADYLMNTKKDGSGANISGDLTVNPTYGAAGVVYELINGSGVLGWIIKLQARGHLVYKYNIIEKWAEDTDSQDAYGFRELRLDQKYMQYPELGYEYGNRIMWEEREPRTKAKKVHFIANRTDALMLAWLVRDVGDLVVIKEDKTGVDNSFYIQGVFFSISSGGLINFSWVIREVLSPGRGLSQLWVEFAGLDAGAIVYGYSPFISGDAVVARTVAVWIDLQSLPGAVPPVEYMLTAISDGGFNGMRFSIEEDGAGDGYLYYMSARPATLPATFRTAVDTISAPNLYHLAVTIELVTINDIPLFYIDGINKATIVDGLEAGAFQSEEGLPFTIGNVYDGAISVDGIVKDVRVFNRILTPTEIATLAADGDITTGLVFHSFYVYTDELAFYEDLPLGSSHKLLEGIHRSIGTAWGAPISRLIP